MWLWEDKPEKIKVNVWIYLHWTLALYVILNPVLVVVVASVIKFITASFIVVWFTLPPLVPQRLPRILPKTYRLHRSGDTDFINCFI